MTAPRACLAGLWIGLLIISGCATDQPPADRTPAAASTPDPTGTLSRPTPSSSSSQSAQRPPSKPKRISATVVMNGDLLWHNTLWYGAKEDAQRRGHGGYDFAPLLAGMKPVIASADMAICHEEVPLARPGGPYRNYPLFAAPPQVVRAIAATGYDVCTTASNHAVDQGFAGLKRTLDDLDRARIPHVGTARTKAESVRPTIFTTKQGVKIAVVAATFSLNGLPMPTAKPWAVQRMSAKGLLGQARRARAAGADVVLAAVHVGTEYSTSENAQQIKLARTLTASPDVDLVYMHHPHVVQPWTTMNKKWVLYGVGNTVAQHATNVPRGAEGATGRFTFTRVGNGRFTVTNAEYIPTLVTYYRPGRPARLYWVSAALKTAKGSFRSRLLDAQRRTTAVVMRKHPQGLMRG
ncbi:MAG TPA: CapA family protein [Propionibacteriaceae bacterium]|nr:CapA family protein [Propionibacteriaceae bacterium]